MYHVQIAKFILIEQFLFYENEKSDDACAFQNVESWDSKSNFLLWILSDLIAYKFWSKIDISKLFDEWNKTSVNFYRYKIYSIKLLLLRMNC